MTTDHSDAADPSVPNLQKLESNLARVEELTQRMLAAMGRKRNIPTSLQGPGQDLYVKAASAWMAEMMSNPGKLLEHQIGWWGKTVKHYVEAQHKLAHGDLTPPEDETPRDKRFSNPLWETHPWFNFIKQQYLFNAEAIEKTVEDIDGMDAREKKRLAYFSRQIVDMMSPTNFLGTNPDALEKAVATEGASLVKGLENLVADLEANGGDLVVTLADREAFKVGENLATTPGKVVYRNRLFELIQYTPTTDEVHSTPLIIFPPWINKFYILDLKAQNSFIKWVVGQGYTVFVVSWVNPDVSYRDVSMSDYIEEGFLTAIREAKAICGTRKVNAIGYCIAGTTLSLTLALMKARKDTSVASATFFTTLTDFSDQGEVGVFLDDDFVDGIEAEVRETGILDSFFMSRTFSYLRSNDLIYQPAIKSYMMGEAPPAFDLLYWNSDSTNMPKDVYLFYLREFYQHNNLSNGRLVVDDVKIDLARVKVPVFMQSGEKDHIAPFRSIYRSAKLYGGPVTFMLAGSGHIAGVINHPAKKKYHYRTNENLPDTVEAWLGGAEKHDYSWWPYWLKWLDRHGTGRKVPARKPGDAGLDIIENAPGSYVLAKSD